MDWDDYKFFSAVARHGSVRGAANDLGVNPSTVTRRLDHFEKRLGVRLFVRSQTGLKLNPDGDDVVASLTAVEQELMAIEKQLTGRDQREAGSVKVMLPEVLAMSTVIAQFSRFNAAFPEVSLELIAESASNDLSKLDADVALVVTDDPPLDLIGRSLGPVQLAVYGKQNVPAQSLLGACIEWSGSGPLAERCRMVSRQLEDAPVRARCASLGQTVALLQAGFAVAVLPCLVGDGQPGLERIPSFASFEAPELWLITEPELRNRIRVRVFVDFLVELFAADPDLLGARS